MDTKTNGNCYLVNKLKESANINLRKTSGKPTFHLVASIQESILPQAIQNHAKMGCLFCSSIVNGGEFRMLYTFGSKVKFPTQESKK